MPDISIIKLKVRRGTDAQRRTIILEQGELGYTTDTNRLYVGDGSTVGGGPVGAVMLKPLTTAVSLTGITGAALYDIVSVSSLLYQLTGSNYTSLSSWAFIGTKVDNSTLQYNGSNALTIKNNGITGTKFASTAAFNQGAIIATATNGLSTNIDNTTVKITTNRLTVGTISAGNISNKALGNGLRGGDGTTLSINATPSSFGYNNSGVLALTALPFGIVNAASLSANTIGPGLFIDTNNKLEATFQTVDASLTLNSNQLSITPVVAGATTTFSNITYNNKGQITGTTSIITRALTGNHPNNSHLSAFNGFPLQSHFTNQSTVTGVSGNPVGRTVNINLTSAGFMSINTAEFGLVAIPIFKYT